MTRVPVGNSLTAVTLLQVLPQTVVRYKTEEKDGYKAVVLGAEKKELDKQKGIKVSYTRMTEFAHDDEYMQAYPVGSEVTGSVLDGITSVTVS